MKFILFSRNTESARYLNISMPALVGGSALALTLMVGGFGYLVALSLGPIQPLHEIRSLQAEMAVQQEELESIRAQAREQIDALAMRMGELNARAIRLNALGRRLTAMAKLDDGEFDFDTKPALGGPLEPLDGGAAGQVATFFNDMDSMDWTLDNQQQQLTVLEGLLMNRKLKDRVSPKGRPVKAGYISSYFGSRTDPFTGKGASHRGVDFAGKSGSDVISVAAGVVTYSGPRYGYGNMVEINHGNGYVTRYAHNKTNLVAPGDRIQPGQVIALMGATGRATGPNLHFEVWHRGQPVNPVKYIRQET